MNKIKLLISIVFHVLFKCNLYKTLYLNFKMLPFKKAVKLPIWIYGKMTFRSLNGIIIIEGKTYPGMIRVGRTDRYVTTNVPQSIWTINGTLKFKGKVNIYQGNYILVSKTGYCEIGTNGTLIGSDIKIFCFNRIVIGDNVRITWENQIYDTSFHYIEQLDNNNEISSLPKAVIIEDNCWIGNRSTITKGTHLPSYSIVASNSLVNKDFSSVGSCSLFAGTPAKFKMKCKRVLDKNIEKDLDLKYGYNRTYL